jgi:hypothetical protein
VHWTFKFCAVDSYADTWLFLIENFLTQLYPPHSLLRLMIPRVEDFFFQARGRKWGIGEKIQIRLNNKPMGFGLPTQTPLVHLLTFKKIYSIWTEIMVSFSSENYFHVLQVNLNKIVKFGFQVSATNWSKVSMLCAQILELTVVSYLPKPHWFIYPHF